MGLLSGKLTPEKLQEKTDVRSRELLRYLEGGEPTVRDLVGGGPPKSTAGEIPAGGISSLVAVLNKVAERVGKTPAQVSLNWHMCKRIAGRLVGAWILRTSRFWTLPPTSFPSSSADVASRLRTRSLWGTSLSGGSLTERAQERNTSSRT